MIKEYACEGQMDIFDFLGTKKREPAAGFMNEPVKPEHYCIDCKYLGGKNGVRGRNGWCHMEKEECKDGNMWEKYETPYKCKTCIHHEGLRTCKAHGCDEGRNWMPTEEGWDQWFTETLLRGSGFSGGKKRIIAIYDSSMNQQERIQALKKEYGSGGWTDSRKNSFIWGSDHDSRGISVTIKTPDRKFMREMYKWPQIDEKLQELIFAGKYVKDEEDEDD